MAAWVLLADDQALIRAGFRVFVESQPDLEVVAEAVDGLHAVDLARRMQPDVVVMDIRMPRLDGIKATRRIAASGISGPVLVVTTFDLDDYVFDALRAGASGFLLKNAAPEEVVRAMGIVAAGDGLLAPEVTRTLIDELARRPAPAAEPAGLAELTVREREILLLVARGLSNAEIADALVLTEGTVKTHVGNLLRKLGLRDRVQAVVLAYESGLVRPGADGGSS